MKKILVILSILSLGGNVSFSPSSSLSTLRATSLPESPAALAGLEDALDEEEPIPFDETRFLSTLFHERGSRGRVGVLAEHAFSVTARKGFGLFTVPLTAGKGIAFSPKQIAEIRTLIRSPGLPHIDGLTYTHLTRDGNPSTN